ncbi:MAG: flagellar biosynthesis protein FlhB [Gammaproteobacteria bacterium]|nr:MAG: flagellar biosynthesis protein FlhB [Gammaproteobacteria bacterium]
MAEQDQDRNLPATPFKLQEARKKGQVAKSQDVNSLMSLAALLFALYAFGMWAVKKQSELSYFVFNSAGNISFEVTHLLQWFSEIAEMTVMVILPFIMAALLLGVATNIFQTGGPLISFFPIKPDIKRINPVEGFKRVISMKTLIEFIKTMIKIVAFGLVGYVCLKALFPIFFGMLSREPSTYPAFIIAAAVKLFSRLIIVILVVAIIDLVFTKWDFAKKMRMSYRDLKDEVKRREGDPDVRSKRKTIQKELLQKIQAMGQVPGADVVVTNPTHFAVAIKYDQQKMNAPQIVAKGTDHIALKIRKIARQNRIPIIENRPLARKLYFLGKVDSPVPEALFQPVAHILAWVFGLRPDLTEGVVRT